MSVVQVRGFDVTVPAGTTAAAPLSTDLPIDDYWQVEWVEVQYPPGPNGRVGMYLASSGTPMIPFAPPAAPIWLVFNDQTERYDVDPGLNPGSWTAVAYNTGANPHTVYLRFGLSLPPAPLRPTVPLISASALSSISP